MCYDKYPWARQTVQDLRKSGMEILFSVDATKLGNIKHLKNKRYDRVVFNFPHTGVFYKYHPRNILTLFTGKGIADQDRNIRSNQGLLQGFFKAAPAVLKEGSSNASRVTAKTKRKSKVGPDGEESPSYNGAESERDESDQDIELYDTTRSGNWETEMSSKHRGTVLVTLRDTSPYTLWLVLSVELYCSLESDQSTGTCQSLQRNLKMMGHSTNNSAHLRFV
jgi:25S rRNA (uracil2634-N3)-methyltransferase